MKFITTEEGRMISPSYICELKVEPEKYGMDNIEYILFAILANGDKVILKTKLGKTPDDLAKRLEILYEYWDIEVQEIYKLDY